MRAVTALERLIAIAAIQERLGPLRVQLVEATAEQRGVLLANCGWIGRAYSGLIPREKQVRLLRPLWVYTSSERDPRFGGANYQLI
jgi:hypothetical protein